MRRGSRTNQNQALCVLLLLGLVAAMPGAARAADEHPLLSLMQDELKLSMDQLVGSDGTKPYFIQYAVTDEKSVYVTASLGALTDDNIRHGRMADVDVRCGEYKLDSTHQIRGGSGGYDSGGGGTATLPLNDDPLTTRHALWLATDEEFKSVAKRLAEVQANVKVKVEEEDLSDDFSQEEPSVYVGPWVEQKYDRARLAERVKKLSRRFRDYPKIYSSSVTLTGEVTNRLAVNSEGSKLQFGRGSWRIGIQASTIADDGMELWQYQAFDAFTPEGLPDDEKVAKAVDEVIEQVMALREAPIVEPYAGPAILLNRASGVFFHEIFGHRIEGHRQKDVEEGQTYAKKIGQEILPTFISVVDDPTRKQFKGVDLNGFYQFDDECVPAQPARIVENGVLKTFLLSRSPTRGFTKSNGHGRREPGNSVVSRQGNLVIESSKQVPYKELRDMLVAECKKQDKEYGLLFSDISGGFTSTGRYGPQAFKVLPILVYKVYADGRPDHLVRGVDIVGTPLTCFSRILAAADDSDIFNGTCGAESGGVPVSAISPSLLIEQIEVEKKQKAQDRTPILDAPIASEKPGAAEKPKDKVEKGKEKTADLATPAAAAQEPPKDKPVKEPAVNKDAAKELAEQMKQDVILRAIVDELERNKDGLKLEDLQRPYFIEYALIDLAGASATADLGALTGSNQSRSRNLRTEIRVGSYQLDNTNFGGGSGGFFGGGGADIPLEDDYNAIRQGIWWATDREYKDVIESYEGKLAFMKTKMIEDKPDDFSREEPAVFFEERLTPAIDLKKLENLALELSKVFRDYPDVQDSGVSIGGGGGNKYLVNNEGTRIRTSGMWYVLQVMAQVQADDGMKMSDSFTLYYRKLEDFPPLPDIIERCRKMAQRLIEVKNAPKLESYTGPVLLDAEPAAQVFGQRFGGRFAGGQRPVGSGTDADDFENKLEKRILPRFLTVVDDPTQETIEGTPVMGHYEYDDQGVKVAPLTLVEKGRLKTLVMSRNPSKKLKKSNGHGRGMYRSGASIGTLIVTGSDPLDEPELKQQLTEACKDEDLKFGIRIASFGGGGGMPLVMYRVYPDGKEELVRAAEIARFDLKAFKRMLATGDQPYVLNAGGMQGRTIVAPAILFEELDLAKIDRDFDKPPILPNPLVRSQEKPDEKSEED